MHRTCSALLVSSCLLFACGPDPLEPTEGERKALGQGLPPCPVIPKCDSAHPQLGKPQGFKTFMATLTSTLGFANHRGRDLLLNPGDPQWVIGKFAYGVNDKDIKGEEVDLYLQRDCVGSWEKLATAVTSFDDVVPPVEGVADSGGRIYFQIPAEKQLGEGRHRVLMVVKGDHSRAEAIIEVRPAGTPVAAIDIDGTLTVSEFEEVRAVLVGQTAQANTGAVDVVKALVAKGYRPYYLTARTELLTGRSRQFLQEKGFPPGAVHATLWFAGAVSDAVKIKYKTDDLEQLVKRGMRPGIGLGNTKTDAQAYANLQIARRFMYQFDDAVNGSVRIDDYSAFATELASRLPALCR
jgi:hypothetical protein